MLSKKVEDALNEQIALESFSSSQYLAMASWMGNHGFEGSSKLLYQQADEERMHMLKLFHYVNDAGGYAISPEIKAPQLVFNGFSETFEIIYAQEQRVSKAINEIVSLAYTEKDHTTHNFMQWYVAEQLEEEALFRSIIDKIKLIGDNGGALYMLDKDLGTLPVNTGGPKSPI